MYLTRLWLNLDDPTARADLADPYQLHSTLARLMSDSDTAKPSRFLWRCEQNGASPPTVLLQSEVEPNWGRMAERHGSWALRHGTKTFDPEAFARHHGPLRFRLQANPSVCRTGKRHGLFRDADQLEWLSRRGTAHGFSLLSAGVSQAMRLVGARHKSRGTIVVHSVLFDGFLAVTGPTQFAEAMQLGVGRAKHMGLGLLSVAISRL